MKVEISNLKTIKNYALDNRFTPSYIYKLIKQETLVPVVIDGVQFIDIKEYPSLPLKK